MSRPKVDRQALIDALRLDDLERGVGEPQQLAAYRELEWRKCSRDPAYFIEKYGKLMDKQTGQVEAFHLWPVQRQLLEEWRLHRSTVAVKARQLGVTTLSAHYALWEVLFKEAAKWMLVSASEEKAKDIIDRVQATKDRLPEWMMDRARPENAKRKDRSDAMMRISCGHSEMKVVTSTARSIKGAAANFILDEFTEHEEQERKWRMLLPAIDGGAMAIIIANGEGEDTFYDIYQAAKTPDSIFTPHFFWWGDDPRRLESATIDGKPACEFTKEPQLAAFASGRMVAPWYEGMKKQYLISHKTADEFAFKQQYPSTEYEAFYLTGNSRFDLTMLNAMQLDLHARQVRPRIGNVRKAETGYTFAEHPTGIIRMYEEPIPGAKYVMGIDSAAGDNPVKGDYSVVQVLRITTDKLVQAAVLHAKLRPDQLAYEAERIGWYYNEALCVIEVNFHGQVVRDRMKDGYKRFYYRKRYEKFADEEADALGFWTDGASKTRIIDQIDEYLHSDRVVINDAATIKELNTYEIRENETTGAPKGQNDDLVMGLALAIEGAIDLMTRKTYEPITIISYGRPS